MATTRTNLKQASAPAISPAVEYLQTSRARLNALRLDQERARMAFTKAMAELKNTPKESPERAHRSLVFKRARAHYEGAKATYAQAETMVGVVRDSEAQRMADAQAEASVGAQISQTAWAKAVKEAQAPFEFVVNRKGGRLRPAKGTVRAPCGQVCMNMESMINHRTFCADCQDIVAAQEAREADVLVI